jgi:hypothetical protein
VDPDDLRRSGPNGGKENRQDKVDHPLASARCSALVTYNSNTLVHHGSFLAL